MTPTEIQRQCDEIVKLGEKATRKPWLSKKNHHPYKIVVFDKKEDYTTLDLKAEDSDFIAASRTFAPLAADYILAAVPREARKDEALKVAIEALELNVADWGTSQMTMAEYLQQLKQRSVTALTAITNAFHE